MGPKPPQRRRSRASGSPADLVESIRAGRMAPVVLLTGRDLFSRDAMIAEIRAGTITPGFEGFDDISLSAESVSGADVVNQADVLPMGGGRRLVRVSRAERFKDRDVEAIAAYAESPSTHTCLLLIADPGKGPILPGLKKNVLRVDFPPPRDYQLSRWLEAQARRLGIALDPEAARALSDLMGENYIAAMSALSRAALAVGGKRPRVTRDVIEELAGQGRDANPFHLGDAVFSREPVRAVGILRDLADAGHTGYAVLGMLESQLRRFLKMRARVDAGDPPRAVVQATSPTLPPNIKARLTRQLEWLDGSRLQEAFRIARETDRAIKSGGGADSGHLEALVWRICAL